MNTFMNIILIILICSSSSSSTSLADELEARALAESSLAGPSGSTSAEGATSSNYGARGIGKNGKNDDDDLHDEMEEHQRQMLAFNKAMTTSWKQQKASKIGGFGDRQLAGSAGESNDVVLAREMINKRQLDEKKEEEEKKRRSEAVLGMKGEHADDPNMVLSDTVQFTTQLKSRILQMAEEQEKMESRRAQQVERVEQEKLQETATIGGEKDGGSGSGSGSGGNDDGDGDDGDVTMGSAEGGESESVRRDGVTKEKAGEASTNQFTSREPLASSGLAASLQLLRRTNNLGAQSSGQDVAFGRTGTKKVKTEVTTGKVGDIKYEHRDSQGNLLTTQEAWRLQNYVFHGINPGKRKLDKRKAKLEAAKFSQNQSATEKTQALNNALKHTGQAFVPLQGGAASSSSSSSSSSSGSSKRGK